MARTPGDGEWDDVVEQVDEALRAMNLQDERLRQALLEGVQEALGALGELGSEARVDVEPAVTVLEGGLGEDEPDESAPSDAPQLQVLDGADAPEAPRARTRVRVITPSSLKHTTPPAQTISGSALGDQGRIRVEESQWQTLFRGREARSYRLFCSAGRLEVALDGKLEDLLSEGQSADVEARLVRVRSPQGTSRGTYVRV